MTDIAKRDSQLQENRQNDDMSSIIGMMMAMFMMIMMMDMMSRVIVFADGGSSSSLPGVDWTWVIEGGDVANTEIIGGEALVPYPGSGVGDWYSGLATSGDAGADLFSIGETQDTYNINSLFVTIGYLTSGSSVNVRMYRNVNGIEQCFYNEVFIAGTDPDAYPVIDGKISMTGPFRVEIQSDSALDDGTPVDYDMLIGVPI